MPNLYPYYPVYPAQMNSVPQQPQPQTQQPPSSQIQNGGFVSVRNESEARNYPIAIGTSVTFKDENAPYIYEKTMGFSQLEAPRFDKYRLVKEDATEAPNLTQGELYDDKPILDSLDDLKGQIEDIWDEIEGIKHDRKSEATPKGNPRRNRNGDIRHDEQSK